MKVFTSKEFIDKLRHIATLPTVYYSGGNLWSSWNGYRWRFDCVVSIKSVLWGWCEDKNASHGGAIYGSNGVADFTTDGGLDHCSGVSSDFSNLTAGEYLCMAGTEFSHAGIYLGNGKVFEVTTAWGVDGATISEIDSYGNRSRNGVRSLRWTYHGKLDYIDYTDEPTPTPSDKEVNVYYRVRTQKHGWLEEVKNLNDYAGWENSPITDVAIKVDKGHIKYQVHVKGGNWLGWVTGYDINEWTNGYAGNGKPIDAIRIYYYTPDDIRPYKKAKYRVNNLPWMYDNEPDASGDTFAGIIGVDATKFQITIE